MIRNARRAVERPTKLHSRADLVGLSMIRNARRGAARPTKMHSVADLVG